MIFQNEKNYETLKLIALLVLPLGTFISTFFNIWRIPYGEQIMQTFAALDVLVGTFVTISNEVYKKSLQDKSE